MNTIGYKYLVLTVMGLLGGLGLIAQETQDSITEEGIIHVKNAERAIRTILGEEEIDSLLGEVRLYQDSTFMFCDTAILKNGSELIAIGNVIILQSDTIQAYCDSLVYNATTRRADLFKEVILKNGDEQLNTKSLTYFTDSKQATFSEGAIMTKNNTMLSSKRGNYNVNSKMAYFSEDVKVVDDDLIMDTDTLTYSLEEEKAIFEGPTRVRSKESNIYCEGGYYIMPTKEALFEDNPQYIKGNKIAVANQIFYQGETGDVILEGDAQYIEDDKSASAIKIVYNEKEDITTLTGDAYYKEGNKELYAEALTHRGASGSVDTKGRTTLYDLDTKLEADGITYLDSIELGHATGNVVWTDTVKNLTILCEDMYYREKDNYVKAFGRDSRPILKSVMKDDTMHLVADTLFSFTKVDSLDSLQFFNAYKNVKIFKNDFQAICDSLSYNMSDSLFTLYEFPILWSDTTQLTGDTINIILSNEEIDSVNITNNGFVINESSKEVYNQMKGKLIKADFFKGKLNQMLVEGNSESLHFIQDDFDAYIGMNKTVCNKIRIYFEGAGISNIRFVSNPTSQMTPIISLTSDAMLLEGFNWFEKKRPLSIFDIK